jgi:type IV pilus assembly protein PilA
VEDRQNIGDKRAGNKSGFTLLELTLVVAVLLTVAAIAIPSLLQSKAAAHEAAAVANIRVIHSTQVAYSTSYPAMGFADDLSKLGPPASGNPVSASRAALLDPVLGCLAQPCKKHGYSYQIDEQDLAPVTTYRITAVPTERGRTGKRGFCGASSGLMTADPAGGTRCTIKVSFAWPPKS